MTSLGGLAERRRKATRTERRGRVAPPYRAECCQSGGRGSPFLRRSVDAFARNSFCCNKIWFSAAISAVRFPHRSAVQSAASIDRRGCGRIGRSFADHGGGRLRRPEGVPRTVFRLQGSGVLRPRRRGPRRLCTVPSSLTTLGLPDHRPTSGGADDQAAFGANPLKPFHSTSDAAVALPQQGRSDSISSGKTVRSIRRRLGPLPGHPGTSSKGGEVEWIYRQVVAVQECPSTLDREQVHPGQGRR